MTLGDKPIRLTISERGGIRFSRQADPVNNCIGDALRGRSFGSRGAIKDAFAAAKQVCDASTAKRRGRAAASRAEPKTE